MPVTRNQASSTNGGDEDAFQRLLHTVASLQARSDEQSRLSEEAERRFRMAEERHQEALRMAQERAQELQRQLEAIKEAHEREAPSQQETPQSFWGPPFSREIDETRIPPNFREIMVEPFDGSQDPHAHLQAFQAQMYISGGNDRLSCKLFPRTLKGVAIQWMTTLPPRTIQTFKDLADVFISQFAANKKKQLKVADLFDIKQSREESLKSYLARFNTATVRVNDPDQKFFIKAFQKGLRASPFSDSLALKRPNSMAEIRTRAEKHIEVEEDQEERLAAERTQNRGNEGRMALPKVETSRTEVARKDKYFTPLKEKRAQILREICHTRLLRFPPSSEGRTMGNNPTDWCEFHRTTGHSTEACWTLKTQIEKLVQEGRLTQYVNTRRQWTQGEGSQNRGRSRSRQNSPTPHKGVISTIAGGAQAWPSPFDKTRNEVQAVLTGANVTPLGNRRTGPAITFTKKDCKRPDTGSDEPMVILVTAKQFKVERVLVDQGSSANILYWGVAQKLGIKNLTKCEGVLYGFAGKRVPILGTVEVDTTFGDKMGAKTIPVNYTVVNSEASYNIIMGRPALNKLEAVVSTYHLCMKFPVGQAVVTVWADIPAARKCYEDSLRIELGVRENKVNVLDIDLDPRYFSEGQRPYPVGDLKKVRIGSSADQKTHIGTTLNEEEEKLLVSTLQKNADVFAWTAKDMPGLDPRFMCHELSIKPGSKPVVQKKRKQGEEKRAAIKEEVEKLLAAGFVREVQYPTWLANVVMVRKANGRWRMCTDYTDLNKACPKDPYPLPSIDRLVDEVSGQALLSFMDAYSGYNQSGCILMTKKKRLS
ncbi:hypothetical protein CR513_03082, partial [Mucuna pruriens]